MNASATPLTSRTLPSLAAGLPLGLRWVLRLAARIERGALALHLPDGRALRAQGREPGPEAVLAIRDPAFARRVLLGGDLGFAEAYLRGDWSSPDPAALLACLAANRAALAGRLPGGILMRPWRRLAQALRRNTRAGARRNVHAHYDLGNAFFAAWLDPGLTYSSAIFPPGETDLARAQQHKYRVLAEALRLAPGHRVLEIGCGWGGFAEFAAREIGCRVTGLTVSDEQLAYASRRIREAGLGDRVEISACDYRDVRGSFDAVVAIEMFEAVGEAYWGTFFEVLRDRLVPGGRAGLQVITIAEEDFARYRGESDFIRTHIFPGGLLPARSHLLELSRRHDLPLIAERAFAGDYARTLRLWRERFAGAWPDIRAQGFDERFRRLWEYYLAYCEAGFRLGRTDVVQMVLQRP